MFFLKYLGLEGGASSPSSTQEDSDTMRRIVSELDALPEDRAHHLAAFAYILGRIAHSDAEFSETETSKMQEIIQNLGHLPERQASLVIKIAKSQVLLFGGTDNFLVTRRFKEMTTREQRLELLNCVFAVSAADESISSLEEGQASQISKELGLTHDDLINSRLTYRQHLKTVKQFRAN